MKYDHRGNRARAQRSGALAVAAVSVLVGVVIAALVWTMALELGRVVEEGFRG